MSEGCSEAGAGAGGAPAEEAGRARHPRNFKLRFAERREPGRSYVSPVKPLGLPATVAGKFYSEREGGSAASADAEQRALRRITDMFSLAPRDKLPAPLTSAHECGWWWREARAAGRGDRRLDHRIRDSAWLKARLAVLAADDKLKHK